MSATAISEHAAPEAGEFVDLEVYSIGQSAPPTQHAIHATDRGAVVPLIVSVVDGRFDFDNYAEFDPSRDQTYFVVRGPVHHSDVAKFIRKALIEKAERDFWQSTNRAAPTDVSPRSLSSSDPARVSNGVRVMPGNTPLSPSSLDSSAPPSLRVFAPAPDTEFILPFKVGALELRCDDDRPDHHNYVCLDSTGTGVRTGLILVGTEDGDLGRELMIAAFACLAARIDGLAFDAAAADVAAEQLRALLRDQSGPRPVLRNPIEHESFPLPHSTAEHESHPGRCGMGFQPVPSSLRASVPACLSHEQTATDGGSRDKDVADQAEPRPAPVPADIGAVRHGVQGDPATEVSESCSHETPVAPAVLLGPGGDFARPVHLSV